VKNGCKYFRAVFSQPRSRAYQLHIYGVNTYFAKYSFYSQLKRVTDREQDRPKSDFNKCIGDGTEADARQSLNCIKNKKIKYGEKRLSICRMEFLHPAMWHDHDIDFAR